MSNINGIIAIDKPEKVSSAFVVARLKKITGVKKAGHTGTLDPFATGLMICGLDSGTRLSRFFLKGDKKYIARLHLGIETDTQDLTGEVTNVYKTDFVYNDDFTKKIKAVAQQFEGPQKQSPPFYSALKHNGTPLYKLARKGVLVQKPPRDIVIHYIKITEINPPDIEFEVSCSSGTYIRTLAVDIGKALGCGAHLKKLRRIESCGFVVDNAITLKDLQLLCDLGDLHSKVIKMSDAIFDMQEYVVDTQMAESIKYGKPLSFKKDIPDPEKKGQFFVKLIDRDNNLLSVIEYEKQSKLFKYCCVFNN